jgi:hypothetical protein
MAIAKPARSRITEGIWRILLVHRRPRENVIIINYDCILCVDLSQFPRKPIYRIGSVRKSTAPDIASRKWFQDHDLDNIGRFSAMGSTEGNEGQTRQSVPNLICER